VLDLPATARNNLDRDHPPGSADRAHEPRSHPEGFHDDVLSDHNPPASHTNKQVSALVRPPAADRDTSQGPQGVATVPVLRCGWRATRG
jgi:hypothetical protein